MALTKVSGGILDPGINVAGIVTATGFDGPFTGGSSSNINAGIITATCNATSQLARKVYDDFKEKKDHSLNQKLVNVRNTLEKYNLISALHTLFSKENKIYGNLLPPLSLLSEVDERNLLQSLKDLNFETKSQLAA